MHAYSSLQASLDELDLECPTLRENSRFSQDLLAEAENRLSEELSDLTDGAFDVLVLGSLARQEASQKADMDYLVLAHGLPEDPRTTQRVLQAMDDVVSMSNMSRPGTTGMFARTIAAAELTERIGLEEDTNRAQTHRLLVLWESRSIWKPELHRRLLEAITQRYLIDYDVPKPGVPRFLLNDVIRYWRTLAVDYQAKRWRDRQSDGACAI